MKLLLRRNERASALGRPIFMLDVRAELSDEERAWITKFRLGSVQLYAKKARPDIDASVGGIGLLLLHHAMNITVSVNDLVNGKRVECKDIMEMLAAEDQVKEAAKAFGAVLKAASQFGGEEVVAI
jgi:hypothetical protein